MRRAEGFPAYLSQLLRSTEDSIREQDDVYVTGIIQDSRLIKSGDIFVALPGYSGEDGVCYIEDAINSGASAVLIDKYLYSKCILQDFRVPVIPINSLRDKLGALANAYYRYPSQKLQVFGVTGTNGKTSVSYFLSTVLNELGCPCGFMGTLGVGVLENLKKTSNTTLDVLSNHYYLRKFVDSGMKAVAMEVSSHGLDQKRVDGVKFYGAIYTNLSHDHLDYHYSIDAYAEAKGRLFRDYCPEYAVINGSDNFCDIMTSACNKKKTKILKYSIDKRSMDVYAGNVEYFSDGLRCMVYSPWGKSKLYVPILGGHTTLENVLSVISILGAKGYSLNVLSEAMAHLKSVPGRMQKYGGMGKPSVIVDYAHTPEALDCLLSGVRHGVDRVICIFGCGGDRDREKRNIMGKIAVKKSDKVIVTSDNPRTEDPKVIIGDIIQGIADKVEIVVNREQAIRQVISQANEGDLVVIAGKGHEDYQEIMNKHYHFDDREHVAIALEKWQKSCDRHE